MSKYKHKIENITGFMLLSSIENVWGLYCIDSLSDETKKCYHNFMKRDRKRSDFAKQKLSVLKVICDIALQFYSARRVVLQVV